MPLKPAPAKLFYHKNDKKDPRLGEIVSRLVSQSNTIPKAPPHSVAIVGWPDDRGITLSQGRPGASQAPNRIRKYLYRLTLGIDQSHKIQNVVDIGNLSICKNLENSHKQASKIIKNIIENKAIPLVFGGGNDYAYADLIGLDQGLNQEAQLGVVNIDAHFDARDLRFGPSSGTPYFRLLEHKPSVLCGRNLGEFGIQPQRNSSIYHDYLAQKNVHITLLEQIQKMGTQKAFCQALETLKKSCHHIIVSLDMDAVKHSDAPGVSAPSSNGLSAADVEQIARLSGEDSQVSLFSIYEVSPPLDRDDQTSRLAASVAWCFLSGVSQRFK